LDEFAKAVFEVALAYPEAETIHLVMDNLSTHCRKSLTELCGKEFGGEIWDCFTPHYTPTHSSWLNQAEIEIGMFSRQCLGKRRIADLATLRREADCLEPPSQPRAGKDWLAVRPQKRTPQVRLQKTTYHAVKELAANKGN
jgi:hypothetical protein